MSGTNSSTSSPSHLGHIEILSLARLLYEVLRLCAQFVNRFRDAAIKDALRFDEAFAELRRSALLLTAPAAFVQRRAAHGSQPQ